MKLFAWLLGRGDTPEPKAEPYPELPKPEILTKCCLASVEYGRNLTDLVNCENCGAMYYQLSLWQWNVARESGSRNE